MIAITPSGTRMRPTWMPDGRYASPVTSPTGSGSFATSRSPSAIASIALAVSVRRSMKASSRPSARAAFTSCAFAARIGREEAARALPRGDRHREAQLLGERPEEERQRLPLGLERSDDARDASDVGAVDGVRQRVALEPRHVGDGVADRLQRDLAG